MGCLYLPFPVPCSVDFWGPLCSTVWWSVPETRRGAGRGNQWRETLSRERDTFPEGAEETKLKTRSLRLVSKAGGSAFSRRDSGKGKGSFTQETRTWSKSRWRSGNHHIQDQTVTWQWLTTSPPTGSTHWKQVCWWPRWTMLPGVQQSTKMLCLPGSFTGSCPPCFCSQESEGVSGVSHRVSNLCLMTFQQMGTLGQSTKVLNYFCFTFSYKNHWVKSLSLLG